MRDLNTRITPAALAAAATGDMANAIVACTPGGIEAQESAGQAMLVASEQLPKEINNNGIGRAELEAIGFQFGSDVDELFVTARLPPGWKKVAGENAYWSRILDEKGRVRATIFYKAAFYDRRAHVHFEGRFQCNSYVEVPGDPEHERTAVTDGGTEIHFIGERASKDYALSRVHADEAIAWLSAKFPDWRNPLAYWNQP